MNSNCLKKLEYDKIIEIVTDFCATYKGKEIASKLVPSNKEDIVKQLLEETNEAVSLSYKNGTFDFYDFFDITIDIKKLESNFSLSTKSLLNLAHIFKLSQELKDYFNKDFLDSSDYPILADLFAKLYSNKDIYNKIFSCILDENTIDDKSSKNLLFIRKQKRNLEQSIKQKLNDMIHSNIYSKYIQENVVTIRNDRFVIPVKEEYRSKIKGFIHDISNAGSTVFIEPISVFEMNNELSAIKVQEELEIEKILQEFTQLFRPYINELNLDVDLIGKLDFIFSKSKFSKTINAITPVINSKREIHLKNARHPFIDKTKVVPISVDLGENFSILIITGSNTGGKTVTLKTIGLLTCMACSGLNIPADENSSIYVFDSIYADIGDDQSISDSLSTFSAHMTNIVNITNNITEDSLILLDELGSGTDPLEGSKLAISILDFIKSIGALVVATTHYQELKQYALVTDGFENASVEFDISTLSPTYRLLIGIPGKSNAFDISKKLGLNRSIIDKAKSLMTSSQIDIENLLKNIYNNKSIIEKEKLEVSQELEKVVSLRKALEKDDYNIKQREIDLLNNAKLEARKILLDAKDEANEIIKEMNKTSNNKELENLRSKLNRKIKAIQTENLNINVSTKNSPNEIVDLKDIVPNAKVFVKSLSKEGTILSHVSKSNSVQVQIGSLKMDVNIDDLSLIKVPSKNMSNTSSGIGYTSNFKPKNIKTEINVIGLNVEEAVFVVDKFLDDCYLAKIQTARIIHGKGTGKLRDGIHKFLKTHPHVKSFRMGTYAEGEMGVTVVEFK